MLTQDTDMWKGHGVKQLGDILLEGGLVSPDQLEAAYEEQERVGRALGRVLIEQGVLTESQLVAALATQIGLRFVDLCDFAVDGSAVGRVPGPVCRRHSAIPIGFEDGKLLVAMADPANVFAVDDIRSLTGMDVKPVVATRADVAAAIDRYYRADSDLDDLTSVLDAQEEEDDLSKVKEIVEDAPIVKYVNLLITQAIQDRASDIHLEPTEHDLRVRFRIDGVLHEVMRSPKAHPVRRHQPAEDHGRHQHRRAPHPAGRPPVGQRARQEDRPPRRHPADGVGREGRHADPGQLHGQARPGRPRLLASTTTSATRAASPSPTG